MKPEPGKGGKWNIFFTHVKMGFHVDLDQLIYDQHKKCKNNGMAKFHKQFFANIRVGIEAKLTYSLRYTRGTRPDMPVMIS